MSIFDEQSIITRAAELSSGPDGNSKWQEALGHNVNGAEANRSTGFGGFTYAPAGLNEVMGGSTPDADRVGPMGNLIQAGGSNASEYGPEAYSRLGNKEAEDQPRSLLGAFAHMMSTHSTADWGEVATSQGMKSTFTSSGALRSARNRTIGVGGSPTSSGGQSSHYDADTPYEVVNYNADDNQEAAKSDSTTNDDPAPTAGYSGPGGDQSNAELSSSVGTGPHPKFASSTYGD